MQNHTPKEHNTETPAMEPPQISTRLERGQSLVEFSFILVILLILLAGVSDLGRALFTYIALRDAAQEGALYASINPTAESAIKERVITSSQTVENLATTSTSTAAAKAAMSTSPLSVEVNYPGSTCRGNGVEVRVTYHEFPITMPFLGTLLGKQRIQISTSIVDTIISPPCD